MALDFCGGATLPHKPSPRRVNNDKMNSMFSTAAIAALAIEGNVEAFLFPQLQERQVAQSVLSLAIEMTMGSSDESGDDDSAIGSTDDDDEDGEPLPKRLRRRNHYKRIEKNNTLFYSCSCRKFHVVLQSVMRILGMDVNFGRTSVFLSLCLRRLST